MPTYHRHGFSSYLNRPRFSMSRIHQTAPEFKNRSMHLIADYCYRLLHSDVLWNMWSMLVCVHRTLARFAHTHSLIESLYLSSFIHSEWLFSLFSMCYRVTLTLRVFMWLYAFVCESLYFSLSLSFFSSHSSHSLWCVKRKRMNASTRPILTVVRYFRFSVCNQLLRA